MIFKVHFKPNYFMILWLYKEYSVDETIRKLNDAHEVSGIQQDQKVLFFGSFMLIQ